MSDGPEYEGEKDAWVKQMLAMAEKYLKTVMPSPPISFQIRRDELQGHLAERADHWRGEATLLQEGKVNPSEDDVKAAVAYLWNHGEKSIDQTLDVLRPKAETVARREAIEYALVKSRTFDFLAKHLGPAELFSLSADVAASYELVPGGFPR